MTAGADEHKETLHRYLRSRRESLLANLDGLGEYDLRRPMTRTGTNLLGLVKHVASVQLGYFTEVFGLELGWDLPWDDEDAEPDADLWVPAEESTAGVLDLWRYSASRSDETVRTLPLDAPGAVPWWPAERRDVTLHTMLVHVGYEVAHHAGHADILRETIDGSAGLRPGNPNLTERDDAGWAAHRARIEAAARAAGVQDGSAPRA